MSSYHTIINAKRAYGVNTSAITATELMMWMGRPHTHCAPRKLVGGIDAGDARKEACRSVGYESLPQGRCYE